MTIVLKGAVPVLPAKNVAEAVAFYRDKLGFMPLFDMGNYAGVGRGPVEFHLDGSDASAKPISARVNLEGRRLYRLTCPTTSACGADRPAYLARQVCDVQIGARPGGRSG